MPVQISLGFEHGHPKVWELFRHSSKVVVPFRPDQKTRMKFLTKGERIIVSIPKSQGGHGIVGMGEISENAVVFETGGSFKIGNAFAETYQQEMLSIYGDTANKPAELAKSRCFNKQFKAHSDGLATHKNERLHSQMTPWEYGVEHWGSAQAWSKNRWHPEAFLAYVSVQWAATASFESGISAISWGRVEPAQLHQLSSIAHPNFSNAQWSVILRRLKSRPAAIAPSLKRPAAIAVAPSSKRRILKPTEEPAPTQVEATEKAKPAEFQSASPEAAERKRVAAGDDAGTVAKRLMEAGVESRYHAALRELCQGSSDYLVDIEASDLHGTLDDAGQPITLPVARGIVRKLRAC